MTQAYQIEVQYFGGDEKIPTATVRITKPDGTQINEAATAGNGPINAICNAVERSIGMTITLVDFNVETVGDGSHDATGRVTIQMRHKDRLYTGSAEHTDTIIAAARAIASAVSQAHVFERSVVANTV